MNLPAVNHRPTQEFIYPASRNELILQLFTAAKTSMKLHYYTGKDMNKIPVKSIERNFPYH